MENSYFENNLRLETPQSIGETLGEDPTELEIFERSVAVLERMERNFDDAFGNNPNDIFDGKVLFQRDRSFFSSAAEGLLKSKADLGRKIFANIFVKGLGVVESLDVLNVKVGDSVKSDVIGMLMSVQTATLDTLRKSHSKSGFDYVDRGGVGPLIPKKFKDLQESNQKTAELAIDLSSYSEFSLSEEEYHEMFNGDLEQANVGNCYLVAAIYSLSKSVYFEAIVRSGIKKVSDGSWHVKIPLMNPRAKTIVVHQDEIEGDWDGSWKLPIGASKGYRILEAAYTKAKFGSVDRVKVQGGHSDVTIRYLLGENVYSWSLHKYKDSYDGISGSLDSLSEPDINELRDIFASFDPRFMTVTFASLLDNLGDRVMYEPESGDSTLVFNHAYSMVGYDQARDMVLFVNPWDTAEQLELKFDVFLKSFRTVYFTTFNLKKFHKNLANEGGVCSLGFN